MRVNKSTRFTIATAAALTLLLGSASAGAAPGGGEEEGLGNNLATPVIFADGYGLTGMKTQPYDQYPTATRDDGLRPRTSEEALPFSPTGEPQPYLDPADAYVKDGVTYYMQNGPSVWKAYARDATTTVRSLVYFGDNLTGHQWTTQTRIIHLEMGLEREMGAPQSTYPMTSLYGDHMSEVFGTTGENTPATTARVYTPLGHLVIKKLNRNHEPVATVFSQAIYEGYGVDGEGNFATEVTGSGGLSYAYNWWLTRVTEVPVAGWWRITFKLDESGTWKIDDKKVTVPRNTRIVGKVVSTEVEGEDPLFPIRIIDPFTARVDIQITK